MSCNGSGKVLINSFAGSIQPYDPESIVTQEEEVDGVMVQVQYEKRVPCGLCNNGGPSPEPVYTLVRAGSEV